MSHHLSRTSDLCGDHHLSRSSDLYDDHHLSRTSDLCNDHHLSRTSDLYDDIISSILLKLPVKSLLRFTVTCKSWCSSIMSPRFIKSHIDESSSDINRQKVLFISCEITRSSHLWNETPGFSICSTKAFLSVNSQVLRLEPPLPIHDASYPLVSSCNGLLCMVYRHVIILWNPAIKKWKQIPKVLLQDKCYEPTLFGFAYDSVMEDYKVVTIFALNAKRSNYLFVIYSVNNHSWRKIDTIPVGYRLLSQNPVSVDGTIYMMATLPIQENGSAFEEFAVISLFVADEKFIVTPLPFNNGRYMKLFTFANRLYLSMLLEKEYVVFYLSKLDGEMSWEWTNIMDVPLADWLIEDHCYLGDIICLKENESILWRKIDGVFLEYNVLEGKVFEFTLNRLPQTACLWTMYFESLAALKIPWD